jgi:general secretion pathway protein J
MPRSPANVHSKAPYQAGFTLIEILVVLILVGMISGVLFEALERSNQLRSRFGRELFKVQQGQMAADWYRQTVQGLYPDQPDGSNLFHGDEREFSGLSTNPLGDDYGAPTPITWQIKNNPQDDTTALVYIEDKRETPVLLWRSNTARFVYLDDQQARHERWPPPLGLFPQLPQQILLEANDAGEAITIVATAMGPTEPLLRPQDVFGTKP